MPQSLSVVLLHLVFSAKNRDPLIHPEIEADLHAFLGAIARDCGCVALAIGGTEDHVHLLCSLSRNICIADFVEELKTRSSKWIKTKGRAYSEFHWQSGYGVFSMGKSQEDALKRYIATQKEHHRRVSFQEEFRAILGKYGVEFDERYVWD
ncbi:IS200/IS605 family transposase [Candidatus Sumerlaeota bacterium]|nr:IS200/IS605 family transposase [Candidatus Sumerlaeota bacterium]